MEVSLDLVAKTEKLFPELTAAKGHVTSLGNEAKKLSNDFIGVFKAGSDGAKKFDTAMVKGVSETTLMRRHINELQQTIGKYKTEIDKMSASSKKAGKEGEQSFQSFKVRIREAALEASIMQQKFKLGLVPKDALDASLQGLANVKNEYKNFVQTVDALNPEQKFNAVSQTVGGLAGGFAAAQGAMALFGSESEDVQKALLKVNAALAFSQGINQVLGLRDSFANLAKVLNIGAVAGAQVVQQSQESIASIAQETIGISHQTVALGKSRHEIVEGLKAGKEKITQSITNIAVTKGETAATSSLTVALNLLKAAWAALISPVGLAIAAVAGLFFVMKNLQASSIDMEEVTDKLHNTQAKLNRQREESKNKIDIENQALQTNLDLLRAKAKLAVEQAGGNDTELGKDTQAKADLEILKQEQFILRKQIVDNKKAIADNKIELAALEAEALAASMKFLTETQRAAAINAPGFLKNMFTMSEADKKALLEKIRVNQEAQAKLKQTNDKLIADNNTANAKQVLNQKTFDANKLGQQNATNKEFLEKQQELNDKLLRAQEAFRQAEQALSSRLLSARTEDATGIEKLRLQKQQADEELSLLRRTLIEKGQEEENAAAAKAGRTARVFELSQQQQEQLHRMDMLLLNKFNREVEALENGYAKTRLELIRDTAQREVAEFDLAFKERAKRLKEALLAQGISEIDAERQIAELKTIERKNLEGKIAKDSLAIEEQSSIDRIAARQRGSESEIEFEKKKQLDILKVQLEFAEKRLAIEEALAIFDPNPNRLAAIDALDATISGIKSSILKVQNELTREGEKISLVKLLGITGLTEAEEAEFNAQAQRIVESAISIFSTIFEEQKAINEQAIQNNKEYMDSLDERIQATMDALDKETEAQRKGYANNVDAKKAELAQLQAEKAKAIEDEKRLQRERRKIAQEQAAVDAIVQGSQLLSAGATLFAKGAFTGAIGIISAIATIAAMIASFVALKSKVAQATRLERGGLVDGKLHSEGGNKYYSKDSSKIIEIERGEFITNRQSTMRHIKILKAINEGSKVEFIDLQPLLKGTGVTILKQGVEKNVTNESTQLHKTEVNQQINIRLTGVEQRLDNIHREVSEVKNGINSRPHVQVRPDGTQVITERRGNVEEVTVIHPRQ